MKQMTKMVISTKQPDTNEIQLSYKDWNTPRFTFFYMQCILPLEPPWMRPALLVCHWRWRHNQPCEGISVTNFNKIRQPGAELFSGRPFLLTFPDGAAL